MLRPVLLFAIGALLCAPALAGCAADASSASRGAQAVPNVVVPGSTVRHPSVASGCSGTALGAFIGGSDNNAAAGTDSGVLSGSANEACANDSSIDSGHGNLVDNGATDSWIGGGLTNTINAGETYGAIAGGESNRITGSNAGAAFVGGGNGNTASALDAVIGGGASNTNQSSYAVLGGGSSNQIQAGGTYAVLAGGTNNVVSGEGGYVAAGGYNVVSGEGAVIDGGFNNAAAGTFATIPGGYVNSAAGTYSFAAGARASAAQTGTFVWSDGSDGDTILTSARAYQFLARASGGVTFWTNAASTVGATLAPGSGTWASASDRNLKTDVARIDDAAVLDKVAALPIALWSYKSERGVRHVGPMAQDFYAAFRVGEDDKHITSIDEDGVALAAIKALHAENAGLRARLAVEARHDRRVDAELASLRAEMRALRTR
ncbi:MAG TPA: tail fiber domain-containing protein [Candidatus Elarobacter sp.]|nr:tail fiber domain-containing protein [Candidatus Elarobacter sp.]